MFQADIAKLPEQYLLVVKAKGKIHGHLQRWNFLRESIPLLEGQPGMAWGKKNWSSKFLAFLTLSLENIQILDIDRDVI